MTTLAETGPRDHNSIRGYRQGCRQECCKEAYRRWLKMYQPYKYRSTPLVHGTTGGYRRGCHCDACKRAIADYTALYRKENPRKKQDRPEPIRLPWAPMEQFLVGRELTLSTIFNGASLKRWRRDGIPVLSADEVACRFGKHPVEIWGPAFYQEELVV